MNNNDNSAHQTSRRITMQDVADLAGVGIATVDRVINRRAAVKQDTASKVLAAAEQLGFRGSRLIRSQLEASRPGYRLGFLLQKQSTLFYRLLANCLNQACHTYAHADITADVIFLEELSPRAVVEAVEQLTQRCDAVALIAADHPVVNQLVDRVSQQGTPVFTLITELSSRLCAGHIGLDNHAAGRTAGWMLTRLAPLRGPLGIIVGSHRYLCQEQCEVSFRSYCRESGAGNQLVEAVISLEDAALGEEATHELLQQNPDLAGIYCTGGGVGGMIRALRDHSRKVMVVCNELTEETHTALLDGLIDCVFSHPRQQLADAAVKMMVGHLQNSGLDRHLVLPFTIHTAENITTGTTEPLTL